MRLTRAAYTRRKKKIKNVDAQPHPSIESFVSKRETSPTSAVQISRKSGKNSFKFSSTTIII